MIRIVLKLVTPVRALTEIRGSCPLSPNVSNSILSSESLLSTNSYVSDYDLEYMFHQK